MLIEVRAKVAYLEEDKVKKRTETFLVNNCELFVNAEHTVMEYLSELTQAQSYEIQSMRISSIKELCTQFEGEHSFIATLKDIFHDDNGNEKQIKYKVLLWADSLSEANNRTQELARQGYDMLVEGLKQVDYLYLT